MTRTIPLLLALTGCARTASPSPTPDAPPVLRFSSLAPADDTTGAQVRVAETWHLGDAKGPVRLQRIAGLGERFGEHTFGALTRLDGQLLPDLDGTTPWLPYGLDFSGLLEVDDALFLTTHVEARPGALYVTSLSQGTDGALEATGSRPADLSAIRGVKDLCAGVVTPWNTHLGAEEYELDAGRMGADGTYDEARSSYDREDMNMVAMFTDPAQTPLWPYDYGWIPEFTVDAQGEVTATKHTAMGRFSHEVASVAHDGRTVFLSDDASDRGGLFLFIADRRGDLSAGHLYAAKWTVTDDAQMDGRVDWVPLGHSTAQDLAEAMAARTLTFDAIFDRASAEAPDACPEGMRFVHGAHGAECLTLRPGQERVASRLETRRYAGYLGATLEFTKGEGIGWDPDTNTAWFAVSGIKKAMTDGEGDVDLPANPCGAIFALDAVSDQVRDTEGALMPSAFVPTRMHAALRGMPNPDSEGDACDVDGIANPDNVTYLPGHHLLVIAEDTSNHTFPTLWAWDTRGGPLTRLATAPWCGEWSGIHWRPDVAGAGWLSVSMQHAYRYKSCAAPDGVTIPESLAEQTWTGVFGPFPVLTPSP